MKKTLYIHTYIVNEMKTVTTNVVGVSVGGRDDVRGIQYT